MDDAVGPDLSGMGSEPWSDLPSLGPLAAPEPGFWESSRQWVAENAMGAVGLIDQIGRSMSDVARSGGSAGVAVQGAVSKAQNDVAKKGAESFLQRHLPTLIAAAVFGLVYASIKRG